MLSVIAHAAPLVGLAGVLGLILGPVLVRLGALSPLGGFGLFAAGALLGGALALVLGIVGILGTRPKSHRSGAAQAWAGVVIGAALIALLLLLYPGGNVPAIHDITTDPDDPPQFEAIAALPKLAGRNFGYPHGLPDSAKLQRSAYPDLAPIVVEATPEEALERARLAANRLGWQVVEVGDGRLEASVTSSVFWFVDDVVVRVRPSAEGSIVDVRSTSRVGQSDLGANAERIRAFRDELVG